MKILFIIVGAISIKETNFVRNFIKQINLEENKISILADDFLSSSIEKKKNVEKLSMSKNTFNEKIFQRFMENNKFDLIIFVNFEYLLIDDSELTFKKEYLNYIKTRTLFFTVGNNIVYKNNTAFIPEMPENKLTFNFPMGLLKPCPPNISDVESNKDLKVFYWRNLEPLAFLSKDEYRGELKEHLKASKDDKIVSLILDVEQLLVSYSKKIAYHYKVLVDMVYRYLSNLNIPCQLVVGNLTAFPIEQKSSNVKISFLGALTDDLHEKLVRSSDLVLSESISSTTLIDAANLKIPVITLKNSVKLIEKKDDDDKNAIDISFDFEELTEFAKTKLEELISVAPDSVFPYYAFPNRASINFEYKKVFGNYIFTFAELFDERNTTEIMLDLLINQDAVKEELYRIEQYLELRDDALDADDLMEVLSKKNAF